MRINEKKLRVDLELDMPAAAFNARNQILDSYERWFSRVIHVKIKKDEKFQEFSFESSTIWNIKLQTFLNYFSSYFPSWTLENLNEHVNYHHQHPDNANIIDFSYLPQIQMLILMTSQCLHKNRRSWSGLRTTTFLTDDGIFSKAKMNVFHQRISVCH